MAMLDVKQLNKIYTTRFGGNQVEALRSVSFSVEKGEYTAIMGERGLAFLLAISQLESCYIVCPSCENCDEEIEFGYFDPSRRIEKAEVPVKKQVGESLEDVSSWLFNLFALLGDTEGMERLLYYFGTYTCPECGERTEALTGMARYFLP